MRLHESFFAAASLALLVHVTPLQAQPAPPAATPSAAQPGAAESGAELAKQLSNPVASLVSVPFQFNWDQPVGPDDDTRFVLNLQPVIPMSLNEDWNLILRWIMPFIGQPPLAPGLQPSSGMGDIVASFFVSPSKPRRFIWGAGPVFMLPTSADPQLGTAKWGIGPTIVVLKQTKGWTYGALWNHIWSFAGDDVSGGVPRGDVNAGFIQPFLSYTTSNLVTVGVNAEASGNWRLYQRGTAGELEPEDGTQWTVPIHVTATKLTKFGPFPMSIGGGIGVFAAAPNGQPDWRLRLVGTLLLPRR
jgi:hypothetical protein